MKYRWVLLLSSMAFLFSCFSVEAQDVTSDLPRSVNASTMIGMGRYNIMDTYLSPGSNMNYSGFALRVTDERMKYTKLCDGRILRQQLFQIDYASTLNPAGTLREYAGFIDYTLGYHYDFPVLPGLRLLAGASAHVLLGGIYNIQSSNNPASAKADLDLNLSGMAFYSFKIGKLPLFLRYQLQLPFAGVLFSPKYGQSYYEIFQLGNSSGVVPFTSFHNKFVVKNTLTVDIPLPFITLRAGYMGSQYHLDVNGIQSHLNSRYFVIGFVKEFITIGGKRNRSAGQCKGIYD